MLVVIASLPGRPDKREAIAAALTKAAAASRNDPGCLSYAFHSDLEEPDRYVSVEIWADQQSLDAHFGAPHVAELLSVAGDLLAGQPVIEVYPTDGKS
ncbi:MAG: antibiotic biosynthesis monooxygenase [Actinomycetota bacterium]|nr:antibiotic biosynthesis monooxygenase [Actinomycetota bacterium]